MPAGGGEKPLVCFSMRQANNFPTPPPGESPPPGADKNLSPPELINYAKKGIERSSKVRKITFTLITLLDKSSVDEIGDRCAKP